MLLSRLPSRPARRPSGSSPRHARNNLRKQRRHPQVERLEARDLPAILFTPAHEWNGQPIMMSPQGTPGPTGLTPAQLRHAYAFDQISLPGGAAADGSGMTI